jgi:hypothetical protein
MAWIDTFQGGSTGRYSYPNNSNNSFWTPKYQKNFEDERARYITDRRNKNIESATNREYAERAFPSNVEVGVGSDLFGNVEVGPSTVNKKNWRLPEIPSVDDGSMADRQRIFNVDPIGIQTPPPGPGSLGQSGYGLGDLWGGMKNIGSNIGSWAGDNAGSIFDALKTGYDIYNNETVAKPMLRAQQARAADLWNTQKKTMEYNLAAARRNEGRADAYHVDLWNKLSRQDGEAERTYASGSPRVSYV